MASNITKSVKTLSLESALKAYEIGQKIEINTSAGIVIWEFPDRSAIPTVDKRGAYVYSEKAFLASKTVNLVTYHNAKTQSKPQATQTQVQPTFDDLMALAKKVIKNQDDCLQFLSLLADEFVGNGGGNKKK